MSQALRKLTAAVSASGVLVMFINQTRMKIGITFGSPVTTTGGNALKFYASQRLEIRKGSLIKVKEEPVGMNVHVKVVKNKVAPPFREVQLEMKFGEGIPYTLDLFNLAVVHDLIEKKGAWFYYKGAQIGQGKENAYESFKSREDYISEVKEQIFKIYAQEV